MATEMMASCTSSVYNYTSTAVHRAGKKRIVITYYDKALFPQRYRRPGHIAQLQCLRNYFADIQHTLPAGRQRCHRVPLPRTLQRDARFSVEFTLFHKFQHVRPASGRRINTSQKPSRYLPAQHDTPQLVA
ncbi:hypothetical protein BaRGS_00015325, partial [Batillaria attramentaria]